MIPRTLNEKLVELSGYFPVVFLTGPRQSGKTTLVRHAFPELPYVSLENPDTKLIAEQDPRGFLESLPAGGILDEVQRVPHIFNYLQELVDENPEIKFILSGSQNFLLHEKISQSLAGRTGILTLLPFSTTELPVGKSKGTAWEPVAFSGFYPRLFDRHIPPGTFYNAYVSTYIERDVRLMKNITNLSDFSRFLKLCAGRIGQLLNVSSLAADTGISPNTAREWLSILEASYIVYLLKPYHKSFNKRLVKMPKLYFYDTGLLNFLLDVRSPEQLKSHYAMGGVFENLIVIEFLKYFSNKAQRAPLFFWRNNKGKEIDLVIEIGKEELILEIKAGKTRHPDAMKNLEYWQSLSGSTPENAKVIYGGTGEVMAIHHGTFIPWNKFPDFLHSLKI